MRILINILVFFTVITTSFAQDFSMGIKGGTNYNFSGDLKQVYDLTQDEVLYNAKSVQGYHGGLWLKLGDDIFIKTEALYTHFENQFSDSSDSSSPIYTITTNKIDIPVVVGLKILGPLYVFGGPDFQYILNEDFYERDVSKSKETYKEFTTGLHLGVGVTFGSFALDLTWDKGLTENSIEIINDEFNDYHFTNDNRPNQLALSLSIALSK